MKQYPIYLLYVISSERNPNTICAKTHCYPIYYAISLDIMLYYVYIMFMSYLYYIYMCYPIFLLLHVNFLVQDVTISLMLCFCMLAWIVKHSTMCVFLGFSLTHANLPLISSFFTI